jgi:hypothetical protein
VLLFWPLSSSSNLNAAPTELNRTSLVHMCHDRLSAAVSTDPVQRIRTKRDFTTRHPSPLTELDEKFWSYDLRTNQRFTLKEKTLKRSDLAMTVISVFGPAQATGKQW